MPNQSAQDFLSAQTLMVLCASDAMSGSGGRCRFANLLGDSRSFTPEEEALFDATAEFAYRSFRDKAAASRGMAVEAMQAVAQVRVASAGGFVMRGGGKCKKCCRMGVCLCGRCFRHAKHLVTGCSMRAGSRVVGAGCCWRGAGRCTGGCGARRRHPQRPCRNPGGRSGAHVQNAKRFLMSGGC